MQSIFRSAEGTDGDVVVLCHLLAGQLGVATPGGSVHQRRLVRSLPGGVGESFVLLDNAVYPGSLRSQFLCNLGACVRQAPDHLRGLHNGSVRKSWGRRGVFRGSGGGEAGREAVWREDREAEYIQQGNAVRRTSMFVFRAAAKNLSYWSFDHCWLLPSVNSRNATTSGVLSNHAYSLLSDMTACGGSGRHWIYETRHSFHTAQSFCLVHTSCATFGHAQPSVSPTAPAPPVLTPPLPPLSPDSMPPPPQPEANFRD